MNYWSHKKQCKHWHENQCVPGCITECDCKFQAKKCRCQMNNGQNFDEYYSVGKKNNFYPLSVICLTESN